MVNVIAFLSGLIMSIGLIISGMTNPEKVLGFLDVFGQFDPTLIFVMAGALLVTGIGYYWLGRFAKPVLCDNFNLPAKKEIDWPLIFGAAVFGIGWGLAGFCPGPAIVGVGLGLSKAVLFTAAMLIGMLAAKKMLKK